MRRSIRGMLVIAALMTAVPCGRAFSLIGEFADWHVRRIGHGPDPFAYIGGPVNLGEEHRWNLSVIYYGYSGDFLAYFGSGGAVQVDEAVKVLTDLPAMSSVNIDDYPLNSLRVNYSAQRLNMYDLKSTALSLLLEEMGLGDPTTYVFTLRNRWVDQQDITYVVVRRNFDPVTKTYSSYINGELWTFTDIFDGMNESYTVTAPTDPLSRNIPVASFGAIPGSFYTGLTRDDVGGLKYIYSQGNGNVENAEASAFIPQPGVPLPTDPSGTTGGGGLQWSTPAFTNIVNTNVAGIPVTTNFVNTGVRPGIDQFNLVRVNFDELLGAFVQTNVAYTDTVLVGGRLTTQRLGRVLSQPDITFHGADLTGGATDEPSTAIADRTDNFTSHADINGPPAGAADDTGSYGPGTIDSGVVITFNTVGPYFLAGPYPNAISEGTALIGVVWGSFDGTTNAPVVYPQGTLIEDIEELVLGGGR